MRKGDAAAHGRSMAWPMIVACVTLMVAVLYWMHRQPYKRTAEEALQEAIEHQAAQGLAG